MSKIIYCPAFIVVICCLIMGTGCAKNNVPVISNGVNNTVADNKKVKLNLPEGWYARELIFDNAPGFEFNADNNTYINPSDIDWVTMQGGLRIVTKVLFSGHDDGKIGSIVALINKGTAKTESTKAEIGVINSRARPVGIHFELKNGSKVYIWPAYTTKTFKNGWSATPVADKFVLDIANAGEDAYYTVMSKDVAKYLREGWKVDMPMVSEVTVSSESAKEGDKVVIREGDTAVVSGDGCTAKEVTIHIRRNSNPKENYIIGKVVPDFGKWEWKGIITRKFKTLDGKEITLAKDLYDIIVDTGGSETGLCEAIDLRDK